jgi:excisionase family DNA binding protein
MQSKTDLLREYLEVVDSLHGCYLDAITGFRLLVDEYDTTKKRMHAERPHFPLDAFDGATMVYGTAFPRQPQSKVVHSCTQGEYRSRNADGGRNHVVMGQLTLVQIFGFWDDCYRGRIAESCGKKKNDLKLDIMGDQRLLRNSIVHHRGIALKEVERCVILTWFRECDEIKLTPDHFESIVSRTKSDLSVYVHTLWPDAIGGRRHSQTTVDAARCLSCSRSTIYNLIAEGKLRKLMVDSDIRVPWSALWEFIGGPLPDVKRPTAEDLTANLKKRERWIVRKGNAAECPAKWREAVPLDTGNDLAPATAPTLGYLYPKVGDCRLRVGFGAERRNSIHFLATPARI